LLDSNHHNSATGSPSARGDRRARQLIGHVKGIKVDDFAGELRRRARRLRTRAGEELCHPALGTAAIFYDMGLANWSENLTTENTEGAEVELRWRMED